MILFSGLYDVALAQSPQMRMASLTGGTARQSFTPRDSYRHYSDVNTSCADYRPPGATAPRCNGTCPPGLQCVVGGDNCARQWTLARAGDLRDEQAENFSARVKI